MKKIPLSRGQFALVDNKDYEWLMQWKWYAYYCDSRKKFYATRRPRVSDDAPQGKNVLMHRQIMHCPDGKIVDHRKPERTLDNRKKNLRICSKNQNACNRSKNKNNTTGYKGVYWSKSSNKWLASLRYNGKFIYLGCFSDIKEAARQYDKAARKYHKEFAYTNFKK